MECLDCGGHILQRISSTNLVIRKVTTTLGIEIWECTFCNNRILIWSRGGRMSEPALYFGATGQETARLSNSNGIEPRRVDQSLHIVTPAPA